MRKQNVSKENQAVRFIFVPRKPVRKTCTAIIMQAGGDLLKWIVTLRPRLGAVFRAGEGRIGGPKLVKGDDLQRNIRAPG
jgi:hypothetical protein